MEKVFALMNMAFDNLINLHPHLTLQYKYHLLIHNLRGGQRTLALAFMHKPMPYTRTNEVTTKHPYGQPRQLIQDELASTLSTSYVKYEDSEVFETVALSVYTLISMLLSLEGPEGTEQKCVERVC